MKLCDWMKNLPDSTPVSCAVIPGTHDSCARTVILRHFTKCQSLGIGGQLEAGFRYLDIRLEADRRGIKTVHSVIDCRKKSFSREKLYFSDVFSEVEAFLEAHPSELVIMCIKRDDGDGDALYRELYSDFIKPHRELWFFENRIPEIGECRGKIVIFRRDSLPEDLKCIPFGLDFTHSFDRTPEPGSESCITEVVTGTQPFTTILQDNYAVPPKRKWSESVLPCLESRRAGADTLLINFLSCNNGIFSPKAGALYINSAFLSREAEKGAFGIIVCDYAEPEIAKKIISLNTAVL